MQEIMHYKLMFAKSCHKYFPELISTVIFENYYCDYDGPLVNL